MKIFQTSVEALPQHGVDVMIGLIAMRTRDRRSICRRVVNHRRTRLNTVLCG
jgi:hypothetical protein